MHITILGTGNQGLVVGTCLAETGHQVSCIDTDEARVAMLNAGEMPIHEPGLEELVARNQEEDRLNFTTDLAAAVDESLLVLLCFEPRDPDRGGTDLAEITAAVEHIADAMSGYRIIVNKSPCPPGTGDRIVDVLQSRTSHPFDVVVNPDFMKEGNAVDDFMRPDHVVIGCEDVRVFEIMKELYNPFMRTGKPIQPVSRRSAEIAKIATNVMLASRISLMNQLAELCAAYDADVSQVREALSADGRIGSTFLFPGLGYGGHGLPSDVAACVRLAHEKHLDADLLEAIQAVNTRQRQRFLDRILAFYGAGISGARIAVWGAAYKPRTDDLRGAPAIQVIDGLIKAGAEVAVYDPVAANKLRAHYGDRVSIAAKYYHAIQDADGLVIVTEWNEFRRPDYARMAESMRRPVIFDGRNLYTPGVMEQHGFTYFSIGRAPVQPTPVN